MVALLPVGQQKEKMGKGRERKEYGCSQQVGELKVPSSASRKESVMGDR